MRYRRLARLSVAFLAALAGGCGACAPSGQDPTPHAAPSGADRVLAGFTYRDGFEGAGGVTVSVGNVAVRRPRFGPFSLNVARELLLNGIHLSIELPEDEAETPIEGVDSGGAIGSPDSGFPLAEIEDLVPFFINRSDIASVALEGFELEVLRGEDRLFRIRADAGRIITTRGELDLEREVLVSSLDGQRLAAKRALLDWNRSTVSVWGGYELRDNGVASRGASAGFVLKREGRIAPLDGGRLVGTRP